MTKSVSLRQCNLGDRQCLTFSLHARANKVCCFGKSGRLFFIKKTQNNLEMVKW